MESAPFKVKRYYLSQRITNTWEDSYTCCKLFGLRLASIDSEEELHNLDKIARKFPKLFKAKVYIDTKGLTDDQNPEGCWLLSRNDRKLEVVPANCSDVEEKLLCEEVESVDNYDSSENERIDVKATFFSYIGEFGEILFCLQFLLLILTCGNACAK